MTPAPLSEAEIAKALAELPGWTRAGHSISRTAEAASFLAGIELVRRVALAAEAANHHPDMAIRWRRVTFTLSTHDADGLTALDVALAHEIDRLEAQS
ncbi:4a-hydroxytetrahydrobiopterin dehydratase [Nocardia sp. SYP-A9097]|uniref:4a-hydroxytetrahydrobiopterin dehydratase n=1 Tax=Nocardia sp. SYP-A9097 TaxID=2663237 RepID=UPI00129AE1EF|nr:4a-hydroxytetrahydrobiopterin dehydratase [Nocardia sp. SYP-A9097]MRH86580.1 4a-hydroxytetrahydrobiopterin dehydratase [Nocardia sp. SYP-A9097]